ncbi:DUF4468 domain-containing protein [Hymenobacter sp. GOD-10R]|uniref:DUF4468 domain-containing protein n=1 Tax=Hymenobacter sp. GOD-10R TaxID=3093922 RepID=UPI002D78482F|nr:DUF4468 domain-containing protein [Hymenobacter sp. GOD-10R]WRQ26835.1 DUF4468 domain-containing protein [Hymenobacter sp. GOD-10R]
MKAVCTFLLALVSSAALAQPGPYPGYFQLPVNQETKKVEYTAVVPVDDAPREELFSRAEDWLTQLGLTHKVTRRVSNPEAGTLVTHVRSGNSSNNKAFRLAIQVKDGQYQYVIDQITHTQSDYARAGKYSVGTVTTNIEAYGLRRQRRNLIKTIDQIDSWILTTIGGLNSMMVSSEKPTNLI